MPHPLLFFHALGFFFGAFGYVDLRGANAIVVRMSRLLVAFWLDGFFIEKHDGLISVSPYYGNS